MDIIRFPQPQGQELYFSYAELVEDWTSVTWIERQSYKKPSEFSIKGDSAMRLPEQLPLGSLISHLDTAEVMIVENHSIKTKKGQPDSVEVTGRSFTSYLEQRYVSTQQYFVNPDLSYSIKVRHEESLASDKSWNQIVELINIYIQNDYKSVLYQDELKKVLASYGTSLASAGVTGNEAIRLLPRDSLYNVVGELLKIDGLSLRAVRPSILGVQAGLYDIPPDYMVLEVYRGTDRTKSVSFSHEAGDIASAEYLRSIKKSKNAAFVTGKWADLAYVNGLPPLDVNTPDWLGYPWPPDIDYALYNAGYDRRWAMLTTPDIDDRYTEAPSDFDELSILYPDLRGRARALLDSSNEVALSNVDIVSNSNTNVYRKDYNLGDLVAVNGEYDTEAFMRVTEFVEIQDENGFSSYPTLENATRPEETLDT